MPDTTPPVTLPPSTPATSSPGVFNQGQLDTIRKSEGIARAAQKPDYTPLLSADGMEADSPALLLAQCELWREFSGNAVAATTGKEQHTDIGSDAETQLKREIEYLRGKARLKINKNPAWPASTVTAFKARYFIGLDIFTNRALTEQSARDMISHATADDLPAVTAARLEKASELLQAFIGSEAPQSDAQSEATKLRNKRDASFAEVLRLRHDIQLAADAVWPWWDDANLAERREFLIPAGRAFTA